MQPNGLGISKPRPIPVGPHLRSGYIKQGRTVEELAGVCGIAAAGLVIPIALLAGAALFAAWRLWPPVRRRIAATASEPEPRASE